MTVLTIPDAWLMGYLQFHPAATVRDAVAYWQYQSELAAEWERQKSEEAGDEAS